MRKIFLDCGANNGGSIDMFLRDYPGSENFEIYSFEPNPKMFKILNSKFNEMKIQCIQKAVGAVNGVVDFYIGDDLSSSLIKEKKTGNLNSVQKVEIIRLSEFISKNFNIEDQIILKVDIEGGEYDLLEDLISTDKISYVNQLYGEWHYQKCAISKDRHEKLVYDLSNCGLVMKEWCAENRIIEGIVGYHKIIFQKIHILRYFKTVIYILKKIFNAR